MANDVPAQSRAQVAQMTMDWVDLLLLLATVGVYRLLLGPHFGDPGVAGSKVAGGGFFALILARRRFFGMPARGPLRGGFLWSLAGIGALFLLLGGLIAVGFAGSLYEHSRDPAPDVTAQAERSAGDQDDVDRIFDLPTPQLIRSSEEEAAAAKRMADESAAKEAQRRIDHQAHVRA
jgi:hypothetical protein